VLPSFVEMMPIEIAQDINKKVNYSIYSKKSRNLTKNGPILHIYLVIGILMSGVEKTNFGVN